MKLIQIKTSFKAVACHLIDLAAGKFYKLVEQEQHNPQLLGIIKVFRKAVRNKQPHRNDPVFNVRVPLTKGIQ